MSKRRGNSSWGKAAPVPAASATSFEEIVTALRLSKAQYETSESLKEWVRKNKESKYVPPALLKAWGFVVDED